MATTIITKNGSGAPLASDLVAGELAVDLTNGRLYTEDSGGSVIELGLTPSGNVDINGGAIDGTTVGAASASTGAFTTLTASSSLNIASSTTVDGVLDEDNMASNSASKLATQQSIKAYVDSQVTAQDLDFIADSGGALSIDLDSETLTFTGGTGIDTSGLGNAVTFAIDSTVATLTGTQTLTNKTLTSAVLNTGVSGTAVLDEDNMASNSATQLATQQSIKAYVDSQVGSFDTLAEVLAQGNTTGGTDISVSTGDDITFADSSKAIFGAGSDLEIYHNGTGSYIDEKGTGDLYIRSNGNNLRLQNYGGENFLRAVNNGSVEIYYDNSKKLATTSTGIDVTGTVTVGDSHTIGDDSFDNLLIASSSAENIILNANDAGVTVKGDTKFLVETEFGTDRFKVDTSNGDISFYNTAGDNQSLYWDASAESLGIGTDSPSAIVHSKGEGTQFLAEDTSSGNKGGVQVANTAMVIEVDPDNSIASSHIQFKADGSEAMRIDSSGNVGIGTSSISTSKLHLQGTTGTASAVRVESTAADSDAYYIADNDGSVWTWGIDGGASDSWILSNAFGLGTPKMTVTTGGSVGIGTSSPAAELHIQSASPEIRFTDNDTLTNIGKITYLDGRLVLQSDDDNQLGASSIEFQVDGTEAMRIDSSGLEISDSTQATGATLSITNAHDGLWTSGDKIGSIDFRIDDPSTPQKIRAKIHAEGKTTGTYPSASELVFSTSIINTLSEAMRIDSSGNVGIGTDSPSTYSSASELVVDTGLAGGITVVSDSTTGGYGALYFADGTTGNEQYRGFVQYNHNNGGSVDGLIFGTAGSERMRIDSSGNLLVGTTSFSATTRGIKLDADGDIAANQDGQAAAFFGRLTSDGDIAVFRKDGTTVGSIGTSSNTLYIDGSSANTGLQFGGSAIFPRDAGALADAAVDLGGGSYRYKDLYLSSSVDLRNSTATSIDFTSTDTTPSAGQKIGEITWTDSASAYGNTGIKVEGQYTAAGMHSFVLKTNDFSTPANLETRLVVNNSGFQIYDGAGSEAARFDSSGNLLVGCTATPSGSVKGVMLTRDLDSEANKTSTSSTAGVNHFTFFNPNGAVGSISTSASATAFNTSSDQRLKSNIVDAPSASDDIDAIQVRSFDWKADGSHQKYGMVAQELVSVAPEAVSQPEDPQEMMGVDYSKLVPMLIKEVQQLRARVAQLEGAN